MIIHRCPDCLDDITPQRTEADAHDAGLLEPPPAGWHDCPASPKKRSTAAKTQYDWRTHGKG